MLQLGLVFGSAEYLRQSYDRDVRPPSVRLSSVHKTRFISSIVPNVCGMVTRQHIFRPLAFVFETV